MSGYRLEGGALEAGVWSARLHGPEGAPPEVAVRHADALLPGVTLEAEGPGLWRLAVPVPSETLGEGVQTYLVETAGALLGRFAIAAGAALAEDLVAEVSLLRAELDLLKAAFRRHCAEAGD